MRQRWIRGCWSAGLVAHLAVAAGLAQAGSVKGTFVMKTADARLSNARAVRVELGDAKTPGYAVLLSTKPATGNIHEWRISDPADRGSFVYFLLERDGTVWAAALGHEARPGAPIQVVDSVVKASFEVKGNRVVGHYRTPREQTFFDDRYSVDLTFDATLEGK